MGRNHTDGYHWPHLLSVNQAAGKMPGTPQTGDPSLRQRSWCSLQIWQGLGPAADSTQTPSPTQIGTSHCPSLPPSPGCNHHLHAGWEVESKLPEGSAAPEQPLQVTRTRAVFFSRSCLVLFLITDNDTNEKTGVASNTYILPTRPILYQ